jgi:hypothetical protein
MSPQQASDEILAINEAMLQAARLANPRHNQRKTSRWWSPIAEIIRRTSSALDYAKTAILKSTTPGQIPPSNPTLQKKIKKHFRLLLNLLWNRASKKRGVTNLAFRPLLSDIKDLTDPPTRPSQLVKNHAEAHKILSLIVALSSPAHSLTVEDTLSLINSSLTKLKKIGHAKQRRLLRQRLSANTNREVQAVKQGKMRRSITRLNPTKATRSFTSIITDQGQLKTRPKAVHDTIVEGFEAHFTHDNDYINQTKLNEKSQTNFDRLESILAGTYKERHLSELVPSHLTPQQATDLTSLLDVCKKKPPRLRTQSLTKLLTTKTFP